MKLQIEDSYDALIHRIKELTTEGDTALGPAMMASCGLVADSPGAQIIVCTDGMSNNGMGAVSD